ncbi:MAG: tryptophanyl-tRNA synthetase [Actinomycetota bacterium]|jgi:tryptophanyl-tRNA synthetase|nr:tryptophanyl-tRNA synthetase [Actinomycetota bacterium]
MARVLSGIKPTGRVHLGNYLGALRHWVAEQHEADSFYTVVDLHALTVEHDPAELRERTLELVRVLVALGLDPDVCTLFVQSHVAEHAQLGWLMEATVSDGELRRMIQFKEKSRGKESVRVALLTYPALMAADILLYDADRVPVGEDQRQHLELARDLAVRFNHHYGETFVVPEATVPTVGARIMDLQEPTSKMGKSSESGQGTVYLLDPPDEVAKKIRRAVTDTGSEVRYDVAEKPGVSNLLSILGAATGRTPQQAAEGYARYGPLKADTAEAVVELLRPVQERYQELAADPGATGAILRKGAQKAEQVASATLARAQRAIGLLPPS